MESSIRQLMKQGMDVPWMLEMLDEVREME
jgi:hypothetical protein